MSAQTLEIAEAEPNKKRRAPVSVEDKRPPTPEQFDWVTGVLGRLDERFLPALRSQIGEGKGRPGSVTAHGVLGSWLLLATENGHKAEVTDVVSQLMALNENQLAEFGMRPLPTHRAYKRFHDKFSRVRQALAEGFEATDDDGPKMRFDLDWFQDALAQAAIPEDLPTSQSLAVDGTDWETAGRFRRNKALQYDGEAPVDTDDSLDDHNKSTAKARRRAKRDGWEIGPDGRAIHTTDRDCRAGYRTATAGRKGGTYVGSEVHLAIQTRDYTWSGDVTRINQGQDVPGFVRHASLVPAGSHRARAIVPKLVANAKHIQKVIWDRGYSILPFEVAHGPLRQVGIQTVFDLSGLLHDRVTGWVTQPEWLAWS